MGANATKFEELADNKLNSVNLSLREIKDTLQQLNFRMEKIESRLNELGLDQSNQRCTDSYKSNFKTNIDEQTKLSNNDIQSTYKNSQLQLPIYHGDSSYLNSKSDNNYNYPYVENKSYKIKANPNLYSNNLSSINEKFTHNKNLITFDKTLDNQPKKHEENSLHTTISQSKTSDPFLEEPIPNFSILDPFLNKLNVYLIGHQDDMKIYFEILKDNFTFIKEINTSYEEEIFKNLNIINPSIVFTFSPDYLGRCKNNWDTITKGIFERSEGNNIIIRLYKKSDKFKDDCLSSYHHGLNWKSDEETMFKIEWKSPTNKDFSGDFLDEKNKLLKNTKMLIERRIMFLKENNL